MRSITFFLSFIPILALLLLALNLVFAPHSPYQEKSSTFECGFHSFLGQNRSEFELAFFIFGLLFMLFDLDLLFVYPYSMSSASNEVYGLGILLIFLLIVTLGFVFEIGKKALEIDSRQYNYSTNLNSASWNIHMKLFNTDSNKPFFTELMKDKIYTVKCLYSSFVRYYKG